MKQNKLTPCPFCGCVPHVKIAKDFWKIKHYKVECANEWCEDQPATVWNVSKKEAVEAWNRRENDDREIDRALSNRV